MNLHRSSLALYLCERGLTPSRSSALCSRDLTGDPFIASGIRAAIGNHTLSFRDQRHSIKP